MNDKVTQKKYLNLSKTAKIFIVVLGFFTFFSYSLIEPFLLYVKTDHIAFRNLPEDFDNTKVVFVSDIHHGIFFSKNRVKDLVTKINALNPDIVLLGGDYVIDSPKYIEPCFEELGKIKSKFGTFAVLGNHDHWESAERTRMAMLKASIKEVDNRNETIYKNNSKIKICGIADLAENFFDLVAALDGSNEDDFVLFLSHRPDFIETMDNSDLKKVDLMLSGHTHGGQVTFFGLWAPLIPSSYGQRYRTGLVRKGESQVLVSNGVGTTDLPIRFFAKPQINLIYLQKK